MTVKSGWPRYQQIVSSSGRRTVTTRFRLMSPNSLWMQFAASIQPPVTRRSLLMEELHKSPLFNPKGRHAMGVQSAHRHSPLSQHLRWGGRRSEVGWHRFNTLEMKKGDFHDTQLLATQRLET